MMLTFCAKHRFTRSTNIHNLVFNVPYGFAPFAGESACDVLQSGFQAKFFNQELNRHQSVVFAALAGDAQMVVGNATKLGHWLDAPAWM